MFWDRLLPRQTKNTPDYAHILNPTMELGYWKWALETAQQWRVRLGMPREEHWDKVIQNLAPLPVRNGIYPTLEFPEEHSASRMATWLCGVLPGRDIDRDVMRNTLHAVIDGAAGGLVKIKPGARPWSPCVPPA